MEAIALFGIVILNVLVACLQPQWHFAVVYSGAALLNLGLALNAIH